MKLIDRVDLYKLDIDGIDTRDYPDFCDAYFSYGIDENGKELTEQELEDLSMDFIDVINFRIFDEVLFV